MTGPHDPDDPQLAFTRLFVANQAALHGYLVSLVHDLHAADDLLQELAGRLWQRFAQYDSGRPFVAWGIGFARLMVLEWRRRQQRLPLPLDASTLDALADTAAERMDHFEDRRDALMNCLKLLTDHQRHALHLRYQQELPVSSIARLWKRTDMAVYKVLKHAHQSLLTCLTKTLAQSEP